MVVVRSGVAKFSGKKYGYDTSFSAEEHLPSDVGPGWVSIPVRSMKFISEMNTYYKVGKCQPEGVSLSELTEVLRGGFDEVQYRRVA